MKNILKISLFVASFLMIACSKDNNNNNHVETLDAIAPVKLLKATATTVENELMVQWTNPTANSVSKVEISYSTMAKALSTSPNPIIVNAESGKTGSVKIMLPQSIKYFVSAVSISVTGERSEAVTTDATPYDGTEEPIEEEPIPVFLGRADTLISSMINLMFGGPRNVWNSSYPKATGPYWDGDAMVWGQGGAFSGYAAIREAATGTHLESKYANLENRMFNGMEAFITNDNGLGAYACYPASGNDRYYDDNIWIGIDMVDLYELTGNPRYLERAKMVWRLVLDGTDNLTGGGVHWREKPKTQSKHACSTAPASVLGSKLHKATNEMSYLQSAKDYYNWMVSVLQDPADYLVWDNAYHKDNNPALEVEIAKQKYSYNSGQLMQAAVLLYNITGDANYLTNAQNIANASYSRWFVPYHSSVLGETFRILEPTGGDGFWFLSVMVRGYIDLYKVDGNREYVDAIEKSLTNGWLTNCRNKQNHLMSGNLKGDKTETSWPIIQEGAALEMLARIAALERDGL